ncbi:MAG: hypothetical protein A2Z99_11685 [Treponema sp. GWB1_62_6]|nr:MAG: hypothetical protein A2Z99_11685 [Treponema sp. GWB1_62_6]OHE71489.1 MAG: hypothetical protein A2413_18815 [Treponema sp. RIFOXYC1_FULL_61_9]
MSVRLRRTLLRFALAALWISAAVFLFRTYRGHTVLVDNKGAPDGSYAADDLVVVSLDGGKGVEFLRGDRDRMPVVGSRHTISVKTPGGATAESEFTLEFGVDVFMLSVPKMKAGIEPFVEPFVQLAPESRNDPADEEPIIDPTAPPAVDPLAPAAP